MTAVAGAWEAIGAEGRGEAGWHVRRIDPSASCALMAGLHQPGSIPGLLLENAVDQIPSDLVLPRSVGFTVEAMLLGGGATAQVRYALRLAELQYRAVFSVLCEDVASAAAEAASPRDAVRAWFGRLHAWQAFMATHGVGGLSVPAALGLLGELIVLRDEIAPRVGIAAALDMWSGPHGEPNDFTLRGGFLEIKTTSRQAPETLEISNADQLDDEKGALLLGHLRMLSHSDGDTLPDLTRDIRERIAREAPERLGWFDRQLLACGYVAAQDNLYDRRYRRHRLDLFEVAGAFPRLRRQDLRSGIRSCSYVIELTSCASFQVQPERLQTMIDGRTDD